MNDKRQKEVLLISMHDNLSFMGIKYIHYFLLKNGCRSYMLNLPFVKSNNLQALECLKDFVAGMDPCFIGLSLISTEYHSACAISSYLKKHFPEIPIVWGGVHPTIAPETCFPFADYVCIGEGEKTALDLANAFANGQDVKKIPNICYREGESIKKNALYPLIDELDSLTFFDHVPKNSFLQKSDGRIYPIDNAVFMKEARYKGKMYELITSRGCAFSCTYCCNNFFTKLYKSGKIRRRSVENIMLELENALKNHPEIAVVHIQDDSFMACGSEYLKDFCADYRQKIDKPLIVHAIPIYVNHNRIELLKEAGMSWLNMGLQSGSDRICKDIYKRNSLKKDFLKATS